MPVQLHLNGSVFIMTSLNVDVIGSRGERRGLKLLLLNIRSPRPVSRRHMD